MGTLTIGLWWDSLESDPSYALKEYLEVANPKLTGKERDDNKLNKSNYYLNKNGYTKHIYGFVDGKFIIISYEPKAFFHKLHDFKITFHQSQWKNQQEVTHKFTEIFGIKNAQVILCRSQVLRSDFWLDGELTYDQLKQSSYRPGVSVSDQRKGERLTYYLGSKLPKLALFYQKLTNEIPSIDIKVKNKSATDYATRIEVRYFGKEVPIRTYSDYAQTFDTDVFKIIKTSIFSKQKFLGEASLRRIDADKVASFADAVEKEGLHSARCRFNNGRNFYRTLEPILKSTGVDLQLKKRWQKKLKERIIADFDILEYFKTMEACND